tara:strand:+ start:549 stop:701 length:153 start_codon:yes stop_codon:yes gene_type:complete
LKRSPALPREKGGPIHYPTGTMQQLTDNRHAKSFRASGTERESQTGKAAV